MIRRKYIFIFTFIVTIIAINFYLKPKTVSKTYYAMGTNLTITIAQKRFNNKVFDDSFAEFKRIEKLFKTDVDLSNKEIKEVYNIAKELESKTNGAFSPYLSDVIKLWQFDKTNKTIKKAPNQQQIEAALKSKKINLYAIAKGYGIDKVAQVLIKNNINNFIVNAGGDLFVKGTNFGALWNIGIKESNEILNCNVDSFAIATSSNLYNAYNFNGKKYGHLINGKTGWPTQDEKAISVISNNATLADGYATAVFVDEDDIIKNINKNKDIISVLKSDAYNFSTFNLPKNCNIKKINI
jgi:FAD:protein FMN transferase